jgi:DnaK suppressor protein
VGFADRILMSKVDLVGEAEQQALAGRLRRMNPRAPIRSVHFGKVPIEEVLDIRGFNLNAILEIDPSFLESDEHDHDDAVQSFVFRSNKPFDPNKLEDFLSGLIQVYGPDMLRYKGVLFMKGSDRQTVFQGVHMMMGADLGRRWQPGEKPLTEEALLKMPESAYMNAAQLAFFRARLQQMEQEILSNAGETTEHLRETVIVPDPADRATIEEEHALELRTRDRERKLLKKIQQAIARIDSGDYGYCEETGEPIGLPRLLARPTATLSLEAQQRRELRQKLYGD